MGPVKREIRIIGWDDAPFTFRDKKTVIIGTVFRGGSWMDGVVTSEIEIDGLDSTRKLIRAVNGTPHKKQLKVIMLDGITFGGFNIVDLGKLNDETGLPVIAVVREKPDLDSIRSALSKFDDSDRRWKLIEKAGELNSLDVRNPKTGKIKKIWFQNRGIEADAARSVIRISSTRSFIPEPLRVAHLIGHGLGRRK